MATGEIPSVDLEKRAPMRFVSNVSSSVPHRGAVSMAFLESVLILHLGRGFGNTRVINLDIIKKGPGPRQYFFGGFDKVYKGQPEMIRAPKT